MSARGADSKNGVVSFRPARAPKRTTASTAAASTLRDPMDERRAKHEALQQQMFQRQSHMCAAFPAFPEEILEPWCPVDDKERDSGGGESDC
uniref:Uncharacterized protein n=1 Tax=Cannabis sativa TaxID=3483 RepID=A0A803QC66_CANSA